MADHVFISYSDTDALDFTRQLADELEGGEDKYIDAWWDKRDIDPGRDWDDQIVDAIRSCKCMLFVLTADSTAQGSTCKNEWTWALKYKKPVVPIRLQRDVEQPFGLGNRQWIDFMGEFDAGLAKLRKFLRYMDTSKGQLDAFKDRLADANRDLRRARVEDKPRIQIEVDELIEQINTLQKIVDNPQAAREQTKKNIETGLERERQPEKPVAAKTSTKIINPPPGIAPNYFQDRVVETKQIVDFLNNDSQRLMTIVGRGGVGKTAMVCRLLKGLEGGNLPDGLGEMKRDGIVYLSENGSYRVNFANIFYGLSQLLPAEIMQELDAIYKNPQTSTESKMNTLLEKFSGERVVLLLDNFEPLVDIETFAIRDAELDEALRAFLKGAHTAVKILLTTRVAPQKLNLFEPGRQRPPLILDEGLESPYAENILKEMDKDGLVGLKSATNDLLRRARERTRGYPRALEALFAILASDRYTTLAELLDKPTPENVVEELVGEAFNRLDKNAQKVMQALAVYNRPVTPAAVDYLLLPHLPTMDSAPILKRLVNMHFARRFEGEWFYLHPVDREFAFGLISAEDITAETAKDAKENEEESLRSSRLEGFTQHNLTLRAADYFARARKPRAEWRKLEDLSAQLAEFDLRCAAGDYDTAASVLSDIDFDYLFLWGHYGLMIDLHERITDWIDDSILRVNNLNTLGYSYRDIGQIHRGIQYFEKGISVAQAAKDRDSEGTLLGNLGTAYSDLGEVHQAIEFYEQALGINREIGNRGGEAINLGNLGNAYADLGDARKAIEFYEQGLAIDHEIGDRRGEGEDLGNLGSIYADLGDARKAIEFYEQQLVIVREISDRRVESIGLVSMGDAYFDLDEYHKAIESYQHAIQIADDISFPSVQQSARHGLAETYLHQNDLDSAHATIEGALQYDVSDNNHNATSLHGIVTLRQRDTSSAHQAFTRAISQADEILAKTPEFYSVLDAKGMALCGLALCNGKEHIPTAIETFRAARKIAPHAGIVKSVLRLFDELVKCDEEGVLADVRKAAEGSDQP